MQRRGVAFLKLQPEVFQQRKFNFILLPSAGALAGDNVAEVGDAKNPFGQTARVRIFKTGDAVRGKHQVYIERPRLELHEVFAGHDLLLQSRVTVVVTAANVVDITQTAERLHGQEKQVHADAGYTGVEKRAEIAALERKIDWQIARKRGPIKALVEGAEKETLKAVGKTKAAVRAFVEHPFHILKNLFGHRKVRYRGLAKNGHQLYTLFGLANVVIGGRAAKT